MRSKRILVLGANRYNVPSICAARKAGFFTLAADKNPEAPGLEVADLALPVDVTDPESLLRAVQQHGGVDGVVSMAEPGVRSAARISARLGLASISEQAATHATSKAAMRRLWQSNAHQYTTDFEVVSSVDEAHLAVARLGRFPLIVKPDRSFGGSRGVTRIENNGEVSGAFHAAKTGGLENTDVVIERWLAGVEHSAEVLIWEGKTSLLCVGQKVKSLFPYRVDVSVQYPAPLAAAQESLVADMCQQAVRALGLTLGVAHIEFACTEQGPVLFELGARCGGGHTPQIAHHVSGVDEFVEACRIACGMPPSQFSPTCRRGADYRFLIFAPGTLKRVDIPDRLRADPSILDVGVTLRPGDAVKPLRTTSERAGFLVAIDETLAGGAECADRACQEISVHYADGTVGHASALREFRELALMPARFVLDPEDADQIVHRYQERIAQVGLTFASLNSGSEEKQRIRHSVHASVLRGPAPSVLEIGCGLGCFYKFLSGRGQQCSYLGYDIVPEYIAECSRTYLEARFQLRNVFSEGIDGHYDTVVMSQVLNNRYEKSDNMTVMRKALEMAFERTRVSVSVDMLSKYVEYENPDLFYYAPEEIFRLAKAITPRVVLRHDYRAFEFCIQLFHEGVEGYVR